MMSVEVTDTMAGVTCSAMSANDGNAIICRAGPDSDAAAAAGRGAAAFWAEARFVKSRLPARIIPKTTDAVSRAARDRTFVFVRMLSIDDSSSLAAGRLGRRGLTLLRARSVPGFPRHNGAPAARDT